MYVSMHNNKLLINKRDEAVAVVGAVAVAVAAEYF